MANARFRDRLMFYSALGRTDVYPLQDSTRHLAGEDRGSDRLELTKRLARKSPEISWFRKIPSREITCRETTRLSPTFCESS